MKNLITHFRKNQTGAAIVITIVITMLIGIMVIGITLVTTISNGDSLDNELSTQAKYAAETGVNDAIYAIQNGASIPANPNCSSFINQLQANGVSNVLHQSPEVAYTCLLVKGTPINLQFNVTQEQSAVVHIEPTQATHTLNFSWPIVSTGGWHSLDYCNEASTEFVPPQDYGCPYPVLRVDLYTYNAADTTSQELANDTDTFFMFPVTSGDYTPTDVSFGGQEAKVITAHCDANNCNVTLDMAQPFTDGYARLTSIYYDAGPVTISGDPSVSFENSQLEIDSTGVDQGVLRRIDVRVPLGNPAGTAPNDAANATIALCKRYVVNGPGSVATPGIHINGAPDNATPLCGNALKPAIYLYPPKTEHINVKLSYPTGFATTIPTYNPTSGWNVTAQPSGLITNLSTGKQYPYLYWEGNVDSFDFNMNQGFVVPGKDTATFLQQKLPQIGLNKSETAAFIQYWVPKMEHNSYSLIHFAGSDYTNMAPLDITPKPDAMLRVFMAEEPISKPVPVTAQSFAPFHRTGFTVVEWGGTILGQ